MRCGRSTCASSAAASSSSRARTDPARRPCYAWSQVSPRRRGGELDVDADRGTLGYLGHEPLLYRDLTAVENLDLYGRLYRVPERRERIGMLLERYGLWDVRAERVSSYSRGMTQRLALCRTLLHEPELLVLDEPFTALDAEGADLLDRQLAELSGSATVLLTTHEPARVEPWASARLALA